MKENKKKVIITLLIIVSIITFFFSFKTSINKPLKNLPEVKLKEKDKPNKELAIMVSTDGEKYKKYEGEEWPGTEYKYKEAKCVNNSGKEIKEAITYDEETNTVILESNETLYCTLYFDVTRKITLLADNINIVGKDATLTNIVSNGSFENDFIGWDYAVGMKITKEQAKYGLYSAKHYKVPPYTSAYGNWPIASNHQFYVSGWLYQPDYSLFCYNDFGFVYDGTIHYEGLGSGTANKWVRTSKIVTSPSNSNLSGELAIADSGDEEISNGSCYGDGAMLIDLTESYGNDMPTKEFLDQNIAYFDKTADIKTITGITGEFEVSAKTGKIECDGGEGTIEDGKVTITGNADEISCVIRNNPISTLRANDKNINFFNNLSYKIKKLTKVSFFCYLNLYFLLTTDLIF